MGQVVLAGEPPIAITLRRSARAKRMSLRVSRADGRVTLSLPRWTAEREALAFAREKEDWIRHNLASAPERLNVGIGDTLPFEGIDLPVLARPGRTVRVENGCILVPGAPAQAGARLRAFLKVAARDRLQEAVDHYSLQVGQRVTQLSLRDTRSRWGSCTTDGRLMFSWRLVMAPPQVLDYVAAHEVAHLVEMNHSPAYWRVVREICPGFEAQRAWLRRHGSRLHAIRFGD